MARPQQCDCGSGLFPASILDGYGIFLCYACERCSSRKLAEFRPDIFERYDANEPIEEA
jgi:hypothetical protein